MKSSATVSRSSMSSLPDDDPHRGLTVARPDDPDLLHLSVVGDTYTVLLSGEQTAGRFALIDMLIPAGGGPPAHRHEFEECFHVVEGWVEVTLRDAPPVRLRAGETVNIPANAPHAFRNSGDVPARLLCTAVPDGWRHSLPSSGTASIRGLHPAGAHGREKAGASAARGR